MEAADRERRNGVSVWYDGACPLCSQEIALLQRLDRGGTIAFHDISRPGDDERLPKPRAELLARFHAAENGRLLKGAAAFALVWRNIPGLRWAGRLASMRPILWAMERAYGGFLRVRPRLQAIARRLAAPSRS